MAPQADRSSQPAAPVIFLVGPTGGGKSGLALGLAARIGGVIVNADSMQVYRELRILTARPSRADEQRLPHRLYGFQPADRPCSVACWADLARDAIADSRGAGRVPIVVGGSGLYIRGLIDGLSPIPDIPPAIRAAARRRHAALGGAAFRDELAARDVDGAGRLDAGDSQRLMRAWEVIEATGRPLHQWQALATGDPLIGPMLVVLVQPPRETLYERCDFRFDRMIGDGALDEVVALDELGLASDLPAAKALGVPALRRHIRGEIELDTACDEAKRETRRYAKRQTTWFRHQLPADLVLTGGEAELDRLIAVVERFLLTPKSQATSVAGF